MTRFDAIVVGQGLAGSVLAWTLTLRGWRVAVADATDPGSASRVAAGLVTPITGKRLALSPDFAHQWQTARRFYASVESQSGATFLERRAVVRLFAGERDEAAFAAKSDGEFAGTAERHATLLNPEWFDAGRGGFLMPDAGRLDVPAFLDATRGHFERAGAYAACRVQPAEVVPSADAVLVPSLGWSAGVLVFCEGVQARANPWFPALPFAPSQGELLEVRVPGLHEARIVNRGVWLLPLGDERFLAGATYDRDRLDGIPTAAGRAYIEARLREFLRLPFVVTDHRAGVRPILHERRAASGTHPVFPRMAYLNGLASKGVLVVPEAAERLADVLSGSLGVAHPGGASGLW